MTNTQTQADYPIILAPQSDLTQLRTFRLFAKIYELDVQICFIMSYRQVLGPDPSNPTLTVSTFLPFRISSSGWRLRLAWKTSLTIAEETAAKFNGNPTSVVKKHIKADNPSEMDDSMVIQFIAYLP
jgi:hypothetical protein